MVQFDCLKGSFILFIAIHLVFGVASAQNSASNRIVNGEIIQISKHPYVVSLYRRCCSDCAYEHYCGGTIYNENFIITAANCVRAANKQDILIVAGSSLRTGFLKDGGLIFPVDDLIIHQDETIDLALIRLALKIPLSSSLTMQAVSLAKDAPNAGALGVIVGWGRIAENGDYSEQLREAAVPILQLDQCRSLNKLTDNEICAGHTTVGIDACEGDAGGPLIVAGQLVGVTAWRNECARPDKPGVYTNVVKLNSWILSHIIGVRIDFL